MELLQSLVRVLPWLALSLGSKYKEIQPREDRYNKMGYLKIGPSGRSRVLQTVNLIYEPNHQIETSGTGIFDGGSQAGSGATVTCRVPETTLNSNGTYDTEETTTTTVEFVYEVETLETESKQNYLNQQIPKAVDSTNIKHLAKELCGNYDCIIGFSIAVPDRKINQGSENYCLVMEGSGTCIPYDGSVNVWHSIEEDGGCNATSIEDLVLETLDGNDDSTSPPTRVGVMNESAYIDDVNDWVTAFPAPTDSGDGNVSEVVVVRIIPEDDNVIAGIGGTPSAVAVTSSGLSPAAWVLLGLLGLLLLLLLLLLRRCRKKQNNDKLYDDDSRTAMSASIGAGGRSISSGGDKSYMTADMHNLAMQHSKLDVHKCKSATCDICRSTIGKVDMLPVLESDLSATRALAMSQLREEMEEDEFSTGDEEKPLNPPEEEPRRVPNTSMSFSAQEDYQPQSERPEFEPNEDVQHFQHRPKLDSIDNESEFPSTDGILEDEPRATHNSHRRNEDTKEVLL